MNLPSLFHSDTSQANRRLFDDVFESYDFTFHHVFSAAYSAVCMRELDGIPADWL